MWDATSPPDRHRVRGPREVRERRGRRHGGEAGRRGDGPVHAGRHRSEAPRRRGGQGRAAAGEAARRQRRGDQARRLRAAGQHHVPAGLDHHGEGRPAGERRRSARADPAGDVEDARHHGRSAARGGAVRGALAEGRGPAGGSHRHGVVRQGHEGQAAPGHHRSRRRRARVPDPEGQARDGARRPGGEQGRDRSSTARRIRTTSCGCSASRRSRATSPTRCRTSTGCRA